MAAPDSRDAAEAGEDRRVACANCGYQRANRFCPSCGQNDRDYIRALPPVLGDILKETFELDSRVVRTVKPMFLRPGELPSEFSRNRRARYVSPIRLYIFASLAFFFLLSVTTDFRPRSLEMAGNGEERVKLQAQAEDADVDALKALLPPYQQRKVDEILTRPGMLLSKSILHTLSVTMADYDEPLADWHRFMLARLVDALEDPREAFSLLMDNLPFSMFITLPAYTVLLMLFFFGSRRYFTEHLVFAVQLHTFAFIVFTVLLILPDGEQPRRPAERVAAVSVGPIKSASTSTIAMSTSTAAAARERRRAARAADDDDEADGGFLGWIELLLALWVPAYHYLALRRYYGNGRVKTAIKWAMLSGAYAILLIPGFLLSLALAFLQL